MSKILSQAKELEQEILAHRRKIHRFAETGMDLPQTAEYVFNSLADMGYEPQRLIESGIVAMAGKGDGPVFMLRADMDALPIPEESELEFKADNGNGHLCGHDIHTAMLLGAARILKQNESSLKGRVKLMFQPGEELIKGAKAMVDAGVLKNPDVDAAMMIHVFSGLPVPSGRIHIGGPGPCLAAVDALKITVKGKGCHGAMPDMGVDPINVLARIHTALQTINAREISPRAHASLTIGQISSGSADNVIPQDGFMSGTIRTFDEKVRAFIKQRVEEIVTLVAKTYRAEAEVNYSLNCGVTLNDEKLVEELNVYAGELFGSEEVYPSPLFPISGSEDFAYVTQRVPSVMMALSLGSPAEGYPYPQHHPKIAFDETQIYKGAALYADMAARWLEGRK